MKRNEPVQEIGRRVAPSVDSPALPWPGVLGVVDLASETEWTLRLDDGPARPIKVPGGGWNSEQQSPPIQVMREVRDFVRYERFITVPDLAEGQAVELRFGAVTYGCEVFLDGKKAGEHHGPQVAFRVDLTPLATPGKSQKLEVKAYHRRHYIAKDVSPTADVAVGFDCPDGDDEASRAEAKHWVGWHGHTKLGYGILRSVELVVLPAVHVEEIFVRPSVAGRTLGCEVWLRNGTSESRDLKIEATLSSWNGTDWNYPGIAPVSVTVPARTILHIALPGVNWNLGAESYWWPNIPFREDYLAELHHLNLGIREGGKEWQHYVQRFGFVEHGEGENFYTVNGVRTTGISDATAEGQLSFHDAYSSPAWLPPTGPGTGAPETWRRYMRIGINSNRLLCSPPTEYMMQTADEVGFLLIPEAPVWGNGLSRYNPLYTPQTYFDLGRACRNHPSVARYSLTNEVREVRDEQWPWRAAIDDLREVDDTRPLTFELHAMGHGRVEGRQGGHAWIMEHYADIHEALEPQGGIRGMGEQFWHTNLGLFAVGIRTLRVNDWCYMSGWSWANYWPNFYQGMSHSLHAWKLNNHPDRVDGVDGWDSPIVRFTQQSLHPYLVQDLGLLAENPGPPVQSDNSDGIRWPYDLPVVVAGKPAERIIKVFNGGLTGNLLQLNWSFHWDSPDGPVAAPGGSLSCAIEPGHHATRTIAFVTPALENGCEERHLFIVLESVKDGRMVFRDESACVRVQPLELPPASVSFVGIDHTTGGNWRHIYGTEGHELVGRPAEMPRPRRLQWVSGESVVHQEQTTEFRALEFFQNDMPSTPSDRIAAARSGNEIGFTLNAGDTVRRLSLNVLDWERLDRVQEIEIRDDVHQELLDRQTVSAFADGRFLTWRVRGRIRVTIRSLQQTPATVSAVFFDPDRP